MSQQDSINQFLNPSTTFARQVESTMQDSPLGDNIVTLRDYRHAKEIFIRNNYRLSPKYGFLFYVEFDLNPAITQMKNTQELGMVVKSAGLPKFSIENKLQNAYNRVNVVQTKVKYDPITIAFHDDQGDVVRSFWYDYYSFFYRDSDYSDTLYTQQSKYTARPAVDWGYGPRPVPSYTSGFVPEQYQYIQAIRIYSLYQKNFSEYVLVNPTITAFRHGDHANGQNELLQHEMTVQYESVKYRTGFVTANNVNGFTTLHYDNTTSPIATQVGPNVMMGSAGSPVSVPDTVFDLASNNVHPGEILNSPLNTLAGAAAGIVGGLLNGITSAAGSALGGLLSGALPNLSSSFSIPSLGSLTDSATALGQKAVSALQTEVAGLSSSFTGLLGLGQTPGQSATAANAQTNLLLAANQQISNFTQAAQSASQTMLPSLTSGIQSASTQLGGLTASLGGAASSIGLKLPSTSMLSGISVPSIPSGVATAAGDAAGAASAAAGNLSASVPVAGGNGTWSA